MNHYKIIRNLLCVLLIISIALFPYINNKIRRVKKEVLDIQKQITFSQNQSHDTQNVPLSYDNLMNELTIIVPSFDKYSELWNPFFTFLFKYWPSLLDEYSNIPIILVSNYENYDHPRVYNFKVGEDISWSDNFIKALDQVNTKYVLLLLEDYIITDNIDPIRIKDMLHLLESTHGGYVEITESGPGYLDNYEKHKRFVANYDNIIYRSKLNDTFYRSNTQASLWNTCILKKLLVPGESGWDFELNGNERSKKLINPFYAQIKNPIFIYYNAALKGKYLNEVVQYINNQNIKFTPKKLPIEY